MTDREPATAQVMCRAHQIAAAMPDEYPFGFALYLAEMELAEGTAND